MQNFPRPLPLSFARRTEPFQESVIREMTRLGDETGAINLSQGLPDFDSPQAVLDSAITAIRAGDNQYSFPFGTFELREVIARKTHSYNHFTADPEEGVTVTCGVSEAMMCAILALTDPGDEVVILQPWYENYVPDCHMAGAIPRFVPLHEPDYTIDPDELRAAFTKLTQLVLVNTPHNPTGRVLARAELEVISRSCQELGVIAVTDEIYEYILFDGREHVSIASLPGMEDRTVTISGLGKTYALTGWRVGWTVASPPLTARIRKVHDYLTICAPSPFQAAGITALGLPEAYYARMCSEYAIRRTILLDALGQAGFQFFTPEGAYYVMADFSRIEWDQRKYARPDWSPDRVFAEYLAREVGVAVVPGSSFYTGAGQGSTRVRFNFARTPAALKEAANRLRRLG
jgi:aminotransferase